MSSVPLFNPQQAEQAWRHAFDAPTVIMPGRDPGILFATTTKDRRVGPGDDERGDAHLT